MVTATAMNTEFGKIAAQVSTVETEKTPLEKRTEEIGKWLGIIALIICLLVSGVSILREVLSGKVDLPFIITMVMFGIALAVAAVPEALAGIVTGALAIAMHQMAKSNALMRKMPAVETLGCTTVICSDKTGTLTKGEMTIRRLYAGGKTVEVTGVGYEPVGKFKASGMTKVPGDRAFHQLLLGGILCNDAMVERVGEKWVVRGDPTEGAFLVAATKAGFSNSQTLAENPRIEEIPFSSERKRMSTLHRMKDGREIGFMKGSPEVVLERCNRILDDQGIRPLPEQEKAKILVVNEEMAQSGLRVLGLSCKDLSHERDRIQENFEQNLVFVGLAGMMDPPRDEAIEAVRACRQMSIRPIMITGDHKLTAVAIAKEIGMFQEGHRVLTGEELERMSDEEFADIVDKVSVYARVSPMDKLKIVKAWKNRGEVVAMTGDGVNDAPALKHADIGVAMGITGTDAAKEAADMVLSDDNFASIVKAIERGRWVYDNIKKYLTYLFRCNITEVLVIAGVVLVSGPECLPLLPAAILYMNLATDGLPALALGIAPPDLDLMQRPPRNPKESIFSWDVKAFILLAIFVEIPFFFFLFYQALPDLALARTEIFFLFIIIELIIALNFRSMRYSVFKAPPHLWLIIAILWEIVLVVGLIQIPAVCEAFGIHKPGGADLTLIFAFGVVVFFAMEILKAILRRRMPMGGIQS